MAVRKLPDVALLRQIFDYNPETGEISNKLRPRSMFKTERAYSAWKTAHPVGSSALLEGHSNYYRVSINYQKFFAHRVAYKMHHGTEPAEMIDHINGNGLDNRISNLRPVTTYQNHANRVSHKGVKGASWRPDRNKWEVRIRVEGVRHYFGMFPSLVEAEQVALKAYADLQGPYSLAKSRHSPPPVQPPVDETPHCPPC